MNFNEIKAMDYKYQMNTYAKYDAALLSGNNAVITGEDGREYIDFSSGIGVVSIGFGNDEWAHAVGAQAKQLQHTSNLYYNQPSAMFSKELCEKSGFSKVFLCNSGAEANECAIKLARKYSFDKYGRGRDKIISLYNSFHGRTMAALTATGQEEFHQFFFPFNQGFDYMQANDADSLNDILNADDICAVIIELIQGEGGVCPLDTQYVKTLFNICKKRDILLIVDEVQTGAGRTGYLYLSEYYGIEPNILTSAKGLGNGLPIGACLCDEKLKDVFTPGTHGTTFGANPVVCAGARVVLSHIDESLLKDVREKGEYIRSKLYGIDEVKSVRGMGLMIGIELKTMTSKDAAQAAFKNGLLILTAKSLLRMLPPLTISYEEIDTGLSILKQSLK
ncbi:MAG: aspartate aminotransferase family protein [Oscillospiraceae bacterium]|jgi:acetylornithine/N-succinyldiaminopimelate aminotransferase|nr:aspartate aminotransferase family protein [Oscillospiraceae bacterium]